MARKVRTKKKEKKKRMKLAYRSQTALMTTLVDVKKKFELQYEMEPDTVYVSTDVEKIANVFKSPVTGLLMGVKILEDKDLEDGEFDAYNVEQGVGW